MGMGFIKVKSESEYEFLSQNPKDLGRLRDHPSIRDRCPVRITLSPPRLQLQTLWTWVIGSSWRGKWHLARVKGLAEFVNTMETGVLIIQTRVRITPLILHTS